MTWNRQFRDWTGNGTVQEQPTRPRTGVIALVCLIFVLRFLLHCCLARFYNAMMFSLLSDVMCALVICHLHQTNVSFMLQQLYRVILVHAYKM